MAEEAIELEEYPRFVRHECIPSFAREHSG